MSIIPSIFKFLKCVTEPLSLILLVINRYFERFSADVDFCIIMKGITILNMHLEMPKVDTTLIKIINRVQMFEVLKVMLRQRV